MCNGDCRNCGKFKGETSHPETDYEKLQKEKEYWLTQIDEANKELANIIKAKEEVPMMQGNRISKEYYYMNIAVQVSLRSTCLRRKVGAVIVKDNVMISSGYNGAPSGVENCCDNPDNCIRSRMNIPSGEKLDLCVAVHAEINALMFASKSGFDVRGAQAYVTTFPCISCAKSIIQAGVKTVYYINSYADEFTTKLFNDAGVKLIKLEGSVFRTPEIEMVSTVTANDLDTIDPIVAEIYKYEPGTPEFIRNREEVMKKHKLSWGNEKIYCIPGYQQSEEVVETDVRREFYGQKIATGYRDALEYTGSENRQMVVCGIVRWKDNLVLLESIEGRLKGKLNMIQGHAAYIPTIKNNDLCKILIENMAKELDEEIKIFDTFIQEVQPEVNDPKFVIQTNDNKISSEHLGFVFDIKVPDDILITSIVSGEPEKHKVKTYSKEELRTPEIQNKMDTWLKKVLNKYYL